MAIRTFEIQPIGRRLATPSDGEVSDVNLLSSYWGSGRPRPPATSHGPSREAFEFGAQAAAMLRRARLACHVVMVVLARVIGPVPGFLHGHLLYKYRVNAAATSRALVCVAVVDLYYAAAVPAGGARHGHVYVGIPGVEILQWETCRKHIR